MSKLNLTAQEKRSATILSLVFGLRMLGLFMVMPIFAIYASQYSGATPALIGLALGAYGVASGLLQAPWGWLSDRLGRKPVIVAGLLLFGLGSVLAGLAHSIECLIAGRLLQGIGAVGSTVLALVADVTRPEVRTRAMAMIGMTIGLSFILAMIAGPALSNFVGLAGIFYLTAVLTLVAIACIWFGVPSPSVSQFHLDQGVRADSLFKALKNGALWRLNFGIFVLHAVLTASFVVLPLMLLGHIGLALNQQWKLYLPVLILAFMVMLPLIVVAEKRGKMKGVFVLSISMLIVSELGLSMAHAIWQAGILLWVFFTAFIVLEAQLPSMVSKIAPLAYKGTAMGIYSSSQFLGAFAGGLLGGYLYGTAHFTSIFIACVILLLIWLVLSVSLSVERVSTRIVNLSDAQVDADLEKRFKALPGVVEVAINPSEKVAYLKVNAQQFDEAGILKIIQNKI